MPAIAPGWELDVSRGPDWLLVRVTTSDRNAADTPPLADQLWSLMERHFTYRLALELDDVDLLHSYLVGQLLVLYKRIREHDGVMRLSGLSPYNQEVLHLHHLDDRFPHYSNLEEAVMGNNPRKPR